MKSEVKTIIQIIDTEKNELITKRDKAIENEDEEANISLLSQIQILGDIQKKLYHIYEFSYDMGFMEILTQNYGKNNTELVALNGNKYIVNKDDPVSIHENLLVWPEKESIEDPTVITPIEKGINLDNIIEINTIKED